MDVNIYKVYEVALVLNIFLDMREIASILCVLLDTVLWDDADVHQVPGHEVVAHYPSAWQI